MFARLDFSTFLVRRSEDLSDNESEEKPCVAICGGSICILTGLLEDFELELTESRNREGESQRGRCMKQINRPQMGKKDE